MLWLSRTLTSRTLTPRTVERRGVLASSLSTPLRSPLLYNWSRPQPFPPFQANADRWGLIESKQQITKPQSQNESMWLMAPNGARPLPGFFLQCWGTVKLVVWLGFSILWADHKPSLRPVTALQAVEIKIDAEGEGGRDDTTCWCQSVNQPNCRKKPQRRACAASLLHWVSISQPQADRRSQSSVSVSHAQSPRTESPRTAAGWPWVPGCGCVLHVGVSGFALRAGTRMPSSVWRVWRWYFWSLQGNAGSPSKLGSKSS